MKHVLKMVRISPNEFIITHQEPSATDFKEFRASNGVVIESRSLPFFNVAINTLYVRGCSTANDMDAFTIPDKHVADVMEAIVEYNAQEISFLDNLRNLATQAAAYPVCNSCSFKPVKEEQISFLDNLRNLAIKAAVERIGRRVREFIRRLPSSASGEELEAKVHIMLSDDAGVADKVYAALNLDLPTGVTAERSGSQVLVRAYWGTGNLS
jgi:hypothetical protein